MIYRLAVPSTIEDNDAVRVLEWHVAPGDTVAPGALVVELETHKALIEVRAGQPGVIRALHRAEGDWCPLGDALATLGDTAEEPLDAAAVEMAADFLIG